jgi:hypothetical protein
MDSFRCTDLQDPLEHLNEAQAKAFMIADNRWSEIALWDDRLLAAQLKELAALDLEFSIEVTGFDMGVIRIRNHLWRIGPQ